MRLYSNNLGHDFAAGDTLLYDQKIIPINKLETPKYRAAIMPPPSSVIP